MKITVEMLRAKGMHDVARFAAYWPDGMEVTEENALMAIRLRFDLNLIVKHCFSGRWPAYRVVQRTAFAAYEVVESPAWAANCTALARAFVTAARMEKGT